MQGNGTPLVILCVQQKHILATESLLLHGNFRVNIAFLRVTTPSNSHSQLLEERRMGGAEQILFFSSHNLDQGISFGFIWKSDISE